MEARGADDGGALRKPSGRSVAEWPWPTLLTRVCEGLGVPPSVVNAERWPDVLDLLRTWSEAQAAAATPKPSNVSPEEFDRIVRGG